MYFHSIHTYIYIYHKNEGPLDQSQHDYIYTLLCLGRKTHPLQASSSLQESLSRVWSGLLHWFRKRRGSLQQRLVVDESNSASIFWCSVTGLMVDDISMITDIALDIPMALR